VATPFAAHGEWRGPLLPGETRRIPQRVQHVVGEPTLTYEVTDLRVANPPATAAHEAPTTVSKSDT
jgi:hypothetical protein